MFPHFRNLSLPNNSVSALTKPLAKQLVSWNEEVAKQTEAERALMAEWQALGVPEKAVQRHERAAEFAQRTAQLQVERIRLHADGAGLVEKIVPILRRLRDEAREAIATTRDAVRADLVRIGYERFQNPRGVFNGNARVEAAIDLANSRRDVLQGLEQWLEENAEASRQLKETLQESRGGALMDVLQ